MPSAAFTDMGAMTVIAAAATAAAFLAVMLAFFMSALLFISERYSSQ
jgi:hypothetical protein